MSSNVAFILRRDREKNHFDVENFCREPAQNFVFREVVTCLPRDRLVWEEDNIEHKLKTTLSGCAVSIVDHYPVFSGCP